MSHKWTMVSDNPFPNQHMAFEDHTSKAWQSSGGLRVIVSDNDRFDNDERWRHVSFSRPDKLPDYSDMQEVRRNFFPDEAEVIQIFPPGKEFVNFHPYCLHFWWNKDRRLCPSLTAAAVGPRVGAGA